MVVAVDRELPVSLKQLSDRQLLVRALALCRGTGAFVAALQDLFFLLAEFSPHGLARPALRLRDAVRLLQTQALIERLEEVRVDGALILQRLENDLFH